MACFQGFTPKFFTKLQNFRLFRTNLGKEHIQIIGLNGLELIATAVLVPEGQNCKMQRVVVKEDLTNNGIGSRMMIFCEDVAKKNGFKKLYCHERATAVEFYFKNGYEAQGDYFEEDFIPHLKMNKVL